MQRLVHRRRQKIQPKGNRRAGLDTFFVHLLSASVH